jgi:tetratricopeptide (TPR) repeat protein
MNKLKILVLLTFILPSLLLSNTEELFDTYDYARSQDLKGNSKVAIELFKSITNNKYATKGLIIESYNKIGLINLRLQNYKQAAFYFNKIVDYDSIDNISLTQAQYNIATVYDSQSLYSLAISKYKECYTFRKSFDYKYSFRCPYQIAVIFLDLAEYYTHKNTLEEKLNCLDSAKYYMDMALKDCNNHSANNLKDSSIIEFFEEEISHIKTIEGEIEIAKGNYMRALSIFYNAKEKAIDGINIEIIPYYFLQLAKIKLESYKPGQFDKIKLAIKHNELARLNMDSVDIPRMKAFYYYNAARITFYSTDYIKAIDYADSAIVLFTKSSNHVYISKMNHFIAKCYKELGNFDYFEEHYDLSVASKEKIWADNFTNGMIIINATKPIWKDIDNDTFFDSFHYYIYPVLIALLLIIVSLLYNDLQRKSRQNIQDKSDAAEIMGELTILDNIEEELRHDIDEFIKTSKRHKVENKPGNIGGIYAFILSIIRNIFRWQ